MRLAFPCAFSYRQPADYATMILLSSLVFVRQISNDGDEAASNCLSHTVIVGWSCTISLMSVCVCVWLFSNPWQLNSGFLGFLWWASLTHDCYSVAIIQINLLTLEAIIIAVCVLLFSLSHTHSTKVQTSKNYIILMVFLVFAHSLEFLTLSHKIFTK